MKVFYVITLLLILTSCKGVVSNAGKINAVRHLLAPYFQESNSQDGFDDESNEMNNTPNNPYLNYETSIQSSDVLTEGLNSKSKIYESEYSSEKNSGKNDLQGKIEDYKKGLFDPQTKDILIKIKSEDLKLNDPKPLDLSSFPKTKNDKIKSYQLEDFQVPLKTLSRTKIVGGINIKPEESIEGNKDECHTKNHSRRYARIRKNGNIRNTFCFSFLNTNEPGL